MRKFIAVIFLSVTTLFSATSEAKRRSFARVVGTAAGTVIAKATSANSEKGRLSESQFIELMIKQADEVNRMAPLQLDPLTTMVGGRFEPPRTFAYYYVLNTTKVELLRYYGTLNAYHNELLRNICSMQNNTQLTFFDSYDVIREYRYYDLNEENIMLIRINKNTCTGK